MWVDAWVGEAYMKRFPDPPPSRCHAALHPCTTSNAAVLWLCYLLLHRELDVRAVFSAASMLSRPAFAPRIPNADVASATVANTRLNPTLRKSSNPSTTCPRAPSVANANLEATATETSHQ